MVENKKKAAADARLRVCIPFRQNELTAFENMLEKYGAKKGPYLRQLVLRDLETDKGKASR